MHRNLLKKLLNQYNPVYLEEKNTKLRMLEFLDNCEDCFDRTCRLGHFTASCWLLNKEQNKILLTHHAKLGEWMQLGGHCDGDNNLLRVAIKEAQEESGIENIVADNNNIFDIDLHLIPKFKQEGAHYHFDVRFLLKVVSDEKIKISDESLDLKWFDLHSKKLPTSSRSVFRMLEKYNKAILKDKKDNNIYV